MIVHVLTAEHGTEPGSRLHVYASAEAANAEAASIVNSFLEYCTDAYDWMGWVASPVTADNWREGIEAIHADTRESEEIPEEWREAFVEVQPVEVIGSRVGTTDGLQPIRTLMAELDPNGAAMVALREIIAFDRDLTDAERVAGTVDYDHIIAIAREFNARLPLPLNGIREGDRVLSVLGERDEGKEGERSTGPEALGEVTTIDHLKSGTIYGIEFWKSGVRVLIEAHEMVEPNYRVLTDKHEIAAREAGWTTVTGTNIDPSVTHFYNRERGTIVKGGIVGNPWIWLCRDQNIRIEA